MATTVENNEPIVNLPFLYINGLQMSNDATTPNTILDIAAGQCRDSGNVYDMSSSAVVKINIAVNGINGLDTGTVAASTFYAVYLLADAQGYNTTGAIISLSSTVPLMPKGWSIYRRIGWILLDGSSHILKFYQVSGNGGGRFMQYDAPITVTVTSSGTATAYTALDLSVAVPVTNTGRVQYYFKWTPNAAADTIKFQPTGATGDYIVNTGLITTVAQDEVVEIYPLIATAKPEISYKMSTASATLNAVTVMGYTDNL